MELGLSLGETKPTQKQINSNSSNNNSSNKDGDSALRMSLATENQTHISEKDDKAQRGSVTVVEPPFQLDLLPSAPVLRQTPWSADNGSSENGSSGNMAVVGDFRGFYMNRMTAAAGGGGGEEVSSADTAAAPPFQTDDRAGSKASDEDENGLISRKKLRLSKLQSDFLEESFKEHSTLNNKQKTALAKQLNLRARQVEVWFQNRRARTKSKQTEVDCEYLKSSFETLTEENRRLHKELQELRALKSSSSLYMQSPATTLTMCPSCQRVSTTSTTASAAMTMATPTTASSSSNDIPTAIPLPISRPMFFPFSSNPCRSGHATAVTD